MRTRSRLAFILATLTVVAAIAAAQEAAPATQPGAGMGMYGAGAPAQRPATRQPQGGQPGMYGGGPSVYGGGAPSVYGGPGSGAPRPGSQPPARELRPPDVQLRMMGAAPLYRFIVIHDEWDELPAFSRECPFIGILAGRAEQGLDRAALMAMLDSAQPGDLPPQDLVDLLRSDRHILKIECASFAPGRALQTYAIYLAGANPEQVRDLAAAFVQVYNAAWPQVRGGYVAELTRRLREQRHELERAGIVLRELQTRQVLGEAALDDLKARRLMLEVDRAGLKARFDAARGILERRREPGANTQRLEAIVADAQTDLSTVQAQLRAVDEQLSLALAYAGEADALKTKLQHLPLSVHELERRVRAMTRVLQVRPPDIEVNGPLAISRLIWPDDPAPAPAPGL